MLLRSVRLAPRLALPFFVRGARGFVFCTIIHYVFVSKDAKTSHSCTYSSTLSLVAVVVSTCCLVDLYRDAVVGALSRRRLSGQYASMQGLGIYLGGLRTAGTRASMRVGRGGIAARMFSNSTRPSGLSSNRLRAVVSEG